jgi:hypothetical protein
LLSLEKNGARGEYGFYEALDYTPSRLATGQLYAVVQSWMAHHQGMAFQALAHVLLNAPMTERFMSSTAFRSASLLLQERVPDAVDLYSPRRHFESHEGRVKPVRYEPRIFSGADTPVPEVQLLSNGHYHLMLTLAAAVTAAGTILPSRAGAAIRPAITGEHSAISAIRKRRKSGAIPGIPSAQMPIAATKRSLPMPALSSGGLSDR